MKKLWRWNKGRQETGYDVFPLLISQLLRCDCYLIRIPKGVSIPEHKDKAPEGFRHFRFNLHYGRHKGGVLSNEKYLWKWRNAYFFRPDISKHSMTEITDGRMLIFSFGFLRREPRI